VTLISRALALAAQDINQSGGQKTSGNIVNDGGAVLGTWAYTAQASS